MSDEQKEEKQPASDQQQESPPCQKCGEYLLGWKRALADYDNVKKDLGREKGLLRNTLAEEFLLQLLPVIDNFDQATKHRPEGGEKELENWLTGILHIKTQLEGVANDLGAESFGKASEPFDPHTHECAGSNKEEDRPDDSVLEVIQRGWKLGEKIVRPAKVIVNKLS